MGELEKLRAHLSEAHLHLYHVRKDLLRANIALKRIHNGMPLTSEDRKAIEKALHGMEPTTVEIEREKV